MNKKLYFVLFILIVIFPVSVLANNSDSKVGGVVVAYYATGNSRGDILLKETVDRINSTLHRVGRLFPKCDGVMLQPNESLDSLKSYGIEIAIIVSFRGMNRGKLMVQLEFIPFVKNRYLRRKVLRFKSSIVMNIPYMASIEVLKYERKMPLRFNAIYKNGKITKIGIGQWHHLKKGRYKLKNGGSVTVVDVNRFDSNIKGTVPIRDNYIIDKLSDSSDLFNYYMGIIKDNSFQYYKIRGSAFKGNYAEKRFIQTVAIINPGANICLPGYGSFLSTGSLGFRSAKPNWSGVWLSVSMVAGQFLIVPVKTGFKNSYFPWEGNLTSRNKRMLFFNWYSLPLTFTASYLDQLSYQLKRNRKLPPFFGTPDSAAATLSFFFPGGGHFYKGKNIWGWSYHISEMALGEFISYEGIDSLNGKIAGFAMLGVKIIDIVHAYFTKSTYRYYEDELLPAENIMETKLSLAPIVNFDRESYSLSYRLGISQSF